MGFLMKLFLPVLLASSAFSAVSSYDSCFNHAQQTCAEPGDEWTNGPCSAIYGGFRGNSDNLHKLMASHLTDSFKFLLMASNFNTDVSNRMGMHKFLSGHSDNMWQRGKSLMKYILKRGGKMGNSFKLPHVDMSKITEEVESLAESLDILKAEAENVAIAHKHAMFKKHHDDNPTLDSYDPHIMDYLEEEFLEPYADEIREMTGHLNVMAKIARNDKSRAMGLHLYDQHLL